MGRSVAHVGERPALSEQIQARCSAAALAASGGLGGLARGLGGLVAAFLGALAAFGGPSWLAAHALPPEFEGEADRYIDKIVIPGLEAAAAEGLVDAVDGFCEGIGFSPQQARALVLGTLEGTIAMAIDQDDQSLEDLRNSVTSKGGTTAAGLDALSFGFGKDFL